MRTALKLFCIFLLMGFFLYISCKKEELSVTDFPRVTTFEVKDIDSTGALFTGAILTHGKEEIIDHGFVWGQYSPTLTGAEYISLGRLDNKEKFEIKIDHALATKLKYYLRAFVKTMKYTVYGKEVEFISLGGYAPKINNFWPDSALLGDTIYVTGKYLSKLPYTNTIMFENINVSGILVNDSTLMAAVPNNIDTIFPKIGISIYGNSTYHNKRLKLISPKILSISKNYGYWGDTLIIKGEGFTSNSYRTVRLNDIPVPVIKASDTELWFKVPSNLTKVESEITVGPFNYPKIKFSLGKPEIVYVSVDSTMTPANIICKVRGHKPELTKFYFNNKQIQTVKWDNNDQVTLTLDEKIGGTFGLKAEILGQWSNERSIKLINPWVSFSGTLNSNIEEVISLNGTNLDKVTNLQIGELYTEIISKTYGNIKFKILAYLESYAKTRKIILLNNSNYQFTYETNVSVKINNPVLSFIGPLSLKGYQDTLVIKGENMTGPEIKINGYTINSYSFDPRKIVVYISNIPSSTDNTIEIRFKDYVVDTRDINLQISSPWKVIYKFTENEIFFNQNSGLSLNDKGYCFSGNNHSLYEFDPAKNVWSLINSQFPGISTEQFRLFTHNSELFAISSYSDYSNKTSIFKFNLDKKQWSSEKEYQDINKFNVPFSISDKNYIAGLSFSNTGSVLYEYNPNTKSIANVGSIPFNFNYTSFGFSTGNLGYIIESFRIIRYDPATKQWKALTNLPYLPCQQVSLMNDRLYILNYYKNLSRYNIETNTLDFLSNSPTDSYGFFFPLNNKLYLFDSSFENDKQRKTVLEYDPSLDPKK